MTSFFQPSYWFSLQSAQVGGVSGTVLFFFFVLVFVLGIIARIVAAQKSHDRFIKKLGLDVGSMLITMGLLGMLLYFFSFERIRLFGSRFWYAFWVIGLLVWSGYFVRYVKVKLPAVKDKAAQGAQMRKYLPVKKR